VSSAGPDSMMLAPFLRSLSLGGGHSRRRDAAESAEARVGPAVWPPRRQEHERSRALSTNAAGENILPACRSGVHYQHVSVGIPSS
jgi:hypothetical protein